MSKRLVKYYSGRLNIMANYVDKKEFLLKGLSFDKFIKSKNFIWGFFDIKEIQTEDGPFFHGFLVKYRAESEQEVALPDKHKLSEVTISNIVEAKARFFLHIKSGLILFHPVSIQIELDMFRERFVEIFQEAHEKMFVNAEIQLVEERFELLETLKKFRTISKVEICLHPSNPNLSELWKDFDKHLKKVSATNYKEMYETKKEDSSLDIADDSDIKGKIAMAEDGYGRAGITGEIDGEVRTVTTEDNPLFKQVIEDEEEPENILRELSEIIKKIFSRFINES